MVDSVRLADDKIVSPARSAPPRGSTPAARTAAEPERSPGGTQVPRPPHDDPRTAALAILTRQRRENPARFALGLTAALVRETDEARRAAVIRRIGAFVADLESFDVVPGSALDQWRTLARGVGSGGPGAEAAQRLRELTVPLGQAALATDRAVSGPAVAVQPSPAGAKPAPAGGQGGTNAAPAPPGTVWMDPREPEKSKAAIAAIAGSLDDAGLKRLYAATATEARAVARDLTGEMRRSGYERAASELAQIARTRGLALDRVESEQAKRRAKEADRGR